jgi:ribosomal protein S18 acetylase RimI-like enzyme
VGVEIRRADPAREGDAFLGLMAANGEDVFHARDVIATTEADLWLASDGGVVVGGLLGRAGTTRDGKRRGGVDNLVVMEARRGAGIGLRLMQTAEAHYRALGLDGMFLTVRGDNATARALYDRLGYAVIEERLRMWKDF